MGATRNQSNIMAARAELENGVWVNPKTVKPQRHKYSKHKRKIKQAYAINASLDKQLERLMAYDK